MSEEEIDIKKERIRREILLKRNSLSREELEEKSQRIKEKLFGLKEFKAANFILFYVSKGSEVKTLGMIQEALSKNKRVAVPITLKERKELLFSEISALSELEIGSFGVLEPKEEYRRLVNSGTIDLVVVPGIAFGPCGHRLGYGGGYFDRVLSKMEVTSIGLAFEIQIVDKLPYNERDMPVNKIITEEQILRRPGAN